jgi:SnoaL-like domain
MCDGADCCGGARPVGSSNSARFPGDGADGLPCADRHEIADLFARYARAVDRSDWAALRTIYHSDAFLAHGTYLGDVEGFVSYVASRRSGMVYTAHYLANMVLERLGPNRVAAEVYGWAIQVFAAPSTMVRTGFAAARHRSTFRYVDLVERRGGRWAVTEDHLVLGEVEVEDLRSAPRPGKVLAQRPGHDDPVYRLIDGWRRPSNPTSGQRP